MRPASLLCDQAVLVVVGEQIRRPVDQPLDVRAVQPGHLLGRVGDEVDPPAAALVGVPQHRHRIVRRNHHQIEAARPLGNRLQLDLARLGHGTGVEGADLGSNGVSRADESSCVLGFRDVDRPCLHPVPLQPSAIVSEVLTDRTHEKWIQPECRKTEADVGRDPAAPDLQVLDEERQGYPIQLFGEQ